MLLPVMLFGNYLVKIEGITRDAIEDFQDTGIIPVDFFGNSTLALCDDGGIAFLASDNYRYSLLDDDPLAGYYYMISADVFFTPPEFGPDIQVLCKGVENWLVKIQDLDDIYELNQYPIELKHVSINALTRRDYTPPGYLITRDTTIQQMVDMVDYDTIINNVRQLQNFQTRYSTTDSALACASWLMDLFISYGYDSVYLDSFLIEYAPNVVAIKWGMVHDPGSYVVGCGHFDCTSEMPTVFAPGADDNASGTAAVIEMARVLSGYLFEYTVCLIAFCGEEQGLLGSEHFAQQAYVNNDTIIGVVNLDMFAYSTPDRDTFTIINDTTYINNLWLANTFSACADTYTTLKKRVWTGRRPYSDHASFCLYGFHAMQGRENVYVPNPYYHTTGDSIGGGYNADTMCFKGIQASLATVATLAIPYDQTGVMQEHYHTPGCEYVLQVKPTIVRSGECARVIGYVPGSNGASVSVYNVLGQQVIANSITMTDSGYFVIDMPCDFPPGVYVIRLQADSKGNHQKLIICN
jgi:hypothetical protein